MSIATQISRLTNLRNRIRTRLITLGALNNQSADLSTCTNAIEGLSGIHPAWHMESTTVTNWYDQGNNKYYFKIEVPNSFKISNTLMIYLECSPRWDDDNIFIMYGNPVTAYSFVFTSHKSRGGTYIFNSSAFISEDSVTGIKYLYIEYRSSDVFTATYIYVDDPIPSPSRNNTNTL